MKHPPQQSDRAFGLMFAVVFALIASIAFVFFDATLVWAVYAAVACLVVALLFPRALLPLNRLWGLFAVRFGHINNYVLLAIFFYLVVLPAGVVMRAFVDPMRRKVDPATSSYWSQVGRKADPDTYRDMF